jgi:hypothetical protein
MQQVHLCRVHSSLPLSVSSSLLNYVSSFPHSSSTVRPAPPFGATLPSLTVLPTSPSVEYLSPLFSPPLYLCPYVSYYVHFYSFIFSSPPPLSTSPFISVLSYPIFLPFVFPPTLPTPLPSPLSHCPLLPTSTFFLHLPPFFNPSLPLFPILYSLYLCPFSSISTLCSPPLYSSILHYSPHLFYSLYHSSPFILSSKYSDNICNILTFYILSFYPLLSPVSFCLSICRLSSVVSL